jgi:hypothetical protein
MEFAVVLSPNGRLTAIARKPVGGDCKLAKGDTGPAKSHSGTGCPRHVLHFSEELEGLWSTAEKRPLQIPAKLDFVAI